MPRRSLTAPTSTAPRQLLISSITHEAESPIHRPRPTRLGVQVSRRRIPVFASCEIYHMECPHQAIPARHARLSLAPRHAHFTCPSLSLSVSVRPSVITRQQHSRGQCSGYRQNQPAAAIVFFRWRQGKLFIPMFFFFSFFLSLSCPRPREHSSKKINYWLSPEQVSWVERLRLPLPD